MSKIEIDIEVLLEAKRRLEHRLSRAEGFKKELIAKLLNSDKEQG